MTPLALGQEVAELVLRPAQHRVSSDDVFSDRILHEPVGGDDQDLAGPDVILVQDTVDAAPVIHVRVGVDDRDDRPLAAMLEIKVDAAPRL